MTEQEKRAYQDRMQRVCAFHTPGDVWKAIEKHDNPRGVYEKFLRGIDSRMDVNGMDYGSTPDQHKNFIQKRCNFDNPDKVFKCLENNHPHSNDLFRVLAQSMANARQ
jgi:hypothetical protein